MLRTLSSHLTYADVNGNSRGVHRARRQRLRGQHGRTAPTSWTGQVKSPDIGLGEVDSRTSRTSRSPPSTCRLPRRGRGRWDADGSRCRDNSLKDEDVGQQTVVNFTASVAPPATACRTYNLPFTLNASANDHLILTHRPDPVDGETATEFQISGAGTATKSLVACNPTDVYQGPEVAHLNLLVIDGD